MYSTAFLFIILGLLTPIFMENTFPVLNKRLTKELLDHYSFFNWELPTLGGKVNIHFQALLLTRCWAAVFWLSAY